MSAAYDAYLVAHRNGVHEAFEWIKTHVPVVLAELDKDIDWQIRYGHDESKESKEEYAAYDDYFYGGNKSYAVVQAFNRAWLHHIHNNPHHWQHWVLINDDEKEGTVALKMPYEYVIEMICDWWSFSFRSGDLREIFKWYDDHKGRMILHEITKRQVEDILESIRKELDRLDETVKEAVDKANEQVLMEAT